MTAWCYRLDNKAGLRSCALTLIRELLSHCTLIPCLLKQAVRYQGDIHCLQYTFIFVLMQKGGLPLSPCKPAITEQDCCIHA